MTTNTDYLRFSAYSLRELITRKLASETKFTDLIYKGSNLAILIDIVCYMYQCLLYNVNNAAAESMWSDTLVYENINRLSKLIGYNPKGCTAATTIFTLDNKNKYNCIIPKYAVIDTELIDDNGKRIYYSTDSEVQILNLVESSVQFYNGIWKFYNTVFVGTDEKYLTLLLDQITSDSEKNTYVQNDKIHVYIKEKDSNTYEQWIATVTNLFLNTDNTTIYTQNNKVYNVRLNENKQYEITFGNGFIGKKPPKGALICIFYLDSNCPSAEISLNSVNGKKIKHDSSLFGISKKMYTDIFFNGINQDETTNFEDLKENGEWTNTTTSTTTVKEESVEEIRLNAPLWSKIGNRLVTSNDWEYYIKNQFKDNILDIKCQNNWQYISTFYSWLYNLGIKYHSNPEYYLTKGRLLKYDYIWADAADSNNVYLWIKMKNDAILYKNTIDDNVQNIKIITAEPIYLNALNVSFAFCAQDVDEVRSDIKSLNHEFDINYKNYLEITIDDNTLYANSDILTLIISIIKNFFDESNFTLGCIVNTNELANKILNIGSITRIRTIYKDTNTGAEIILPGISFATWTLDYIDIGDDVEVSTIAKSLEPFQFPKLYKSNDLALRIKIIRKSINQINSIQY